MPTVSHERVPGTPGTPAVPQRGRRGRPRRRPKLVLPGRARVGQLAILGALLAAAGAGLLGVRADRDGDEPATVGQVISVPDGELRVDAVRQWDESEHAQGMPGMPIPDPLPRGYRRFWTDVTIHGTGGAGIPYVPARFTVGGDDLAPIVPHSASEGLDRVLPGAQATVTLLFQVPRDEGDLLLTIEGTDKQVLLPGPDSTGGHGHDDEP